MKFNKFLIVGILLAILTIGAASAADDLAQDDAVAAESDDIALQSDSSDDALGETYFDSDVYVKVEENYEHDLEEWDSNYIVYLASYSKANGTFSISVDDVEKQSLNLTDGYFSIEDNGNGGTYKKTNQYIYPKDLGLDLGSYNIKVKFNEKTLVNTSSTLKVKEDFDIKTYNPYYANKDYWPTSVFIQIDSNHANTGTLEVFVNGTKKVTYNVNNGSFEVIPNTINTIRHIPASKLVDDYGTYNIRITFTENGTVRTLMDDNVLMAERAPTTDPKLELYFDFSRLILPADNIAKIYLPWEATGNLTISYNNIKNAAVEYSKGSGSHYMYAWDLNHLGDNLVTVTYIGDDFGTMTVSKNVTVLPKVTAPSMVSVGEEFSISVLTHEWVYGTFNVYEYKDGKKGKLLASDDLYKRKDTEWATASVTLSSDTVGKNKYYLEFDYPGGDYPIIQEISVFENSNNINVIVPEKVDEGSDFNVTFKGLDSPFTFVYFTVDDNPSTFTMLENGTVTKCISGLPGGYHTIHVYYNNGKMVDGVWTGEVYSKTFTVNVAVHTTLTASAVNCTYDDGSCLIATLKDSNGNALPNRHLIFELGGTNTSIITNSEGQAKMRIKLAPSVYSANISYAGADNYLPSYVVTKVSVTKMDTALSAPAVSTTYNVAKNLVITLKDANGKAIAGKTLTVVFDSNHKYNKATDDDGQVVISVNLPAKSYTAKFTFAGDENYTASSGSAKVTVAKATPKLTASAKTFKVKAKTKKVTATLKTNTNKVIKNTKVTLKVNKKTYTAKTNSKGVATFKVKLTKKGTYKAVYKYAGSSNYKAVSKTVKITVKK